MISSLPIISLRLPDWVERFIADSPRVFPETNDRMRFVLELSRRNVRHGTGGPFGAAIFDSDGRLIAPGINLVVISNCSLLHAEMVALAGAQQILGRYDISDSGITVLRDVLRDEAVGVLRDYVEAGGIIYNAGQQGTYGVLGRTDQ